LKKFLKNWSLLTISSFIQQALQFFVLVKIARVLEPTGYGIYTIILTTVGIGQVISSLGLRQIIIREIARFEDTTKNVAIKSFSISLSAFLFTSVFLVLYLYYFERFNGTLILVLGVVLLLTQVIWNIAEAFSFGKQEMQYSASIGLIGTLIWFLIIFIIPSKSLNLDSVIGFYVLVQLIRALAFVFIEWRNKYFFQYHSPSKLISCKELLSQSLPLYGTSLLSIPITQLPILLLGIFSGKAEVAYYGIGNRLIVPLGMVSGHLLTAIYPFLSKDFISDKETFYRNGRRFFLSIFIIGLFLSVSVSLFGKEIVHILFGSNYEAAINPFSIQMLAALNFIMLNYIGTIFLATNKERLMVKLSVFNGIVIGTANFLGAHYGADGLALSTFCSLIVGFSFHWYYINKYKLIRIGLSEFLILWTAYVVMSFVTLYFLNFYLGWKILIFLMIFSLMIFYVI
jgi:O-antigen/teichoic acid export membrane protein